MTAAGMSPLAVVTLAGLFPFAAGVVEARVSESIATAVAEQIEW